MWSIDNIYRPSSDTWPFDTILWTLSYVIRCCFSIHFSSNATISGMWPINSLLWTFFTHVTIVFLHKFLPRCGFQWTFFHWCVPHGIILDMLPIIVISWFIPGLWLIHPAGIRKFSREFFFANSVKNHICQCKNSRLWHLLHTSVKDKEFSLSPHTRNFAKIRHSRKFPNLQFVTVIFTHEETTMS